MAELMMKVERDCPICGAKQSVIVRQYAYMKWVNKELSIQEAMPELSADEREILLSGVCSRCWGKTFKED